MTMEVHSSCGSNGRILGMHGTESMECWVGCIFMVLNPVCTYSEELSKNVDADPTLDQLNPGLCVWLLGNCHF